MKKMPVVHCTTGIFFMISGRQPRILASMALPVGVSARPPSAVSRNSTGMRRPTSPMVPMTSSTGMRLSMPARADDIAFDARNLHQTRHRVADQAQQILQGHGHGVADLLAAAAPEGHQSPRRHGAGGADLRLTAAGSTGDTGPIGDDGTDAAGYI